MEKLHKTFWFESEKGLGVGVTAYDVDDAKYLIRSEKSVLNYRPNFKSYTEDIDIQLLDQNHVIPNMGIVTNRGIWFPNIK